jgi:hypothetical protein
VLACHVMAATSSQEPSRFPVTLWPGTPLGPVLVQRSALLVGSDGTLDWRAYRKPGELPEEWVLRQLGDADLENDAAVAALLDDYGVISYPYFDPAAVPLDRGSRLTAASAQKAGTDRWWTQRGDGTLEDARWWLKTARALAGVWREASVDGDPPSAWTAEGFPPGTDWDCWPRFTAALDVGLEPFRARVEYKAPLNDGSTFTFGLPRVGLYSAACRQVFNLVVEQRVARYCENATCGRVFDHQLGGAKFGQHRSKGLRFCSPSCARAETQRQYRRRKASIEREQQR